MRKLAWPTKRAHAERAGAWPYVKPWVTPRGGDYPWLKSGSEKRGGLPKDTEVGSEPHSDSCFQHPLLSPTAASHLPRRGRSGRSLCREPRMGYLFLNLTSPESWLAAFTLGHLGREIPKMQPLPACDLVGKMPPYPPKGQGFWKLASGNKTPNPVPPKESDQAASLPSFCTPCPSLCPGSCRVSTLLHSNTTIKEEKPKSIPWLLLRIY